MKPLRRLVKVGLAVLAAIVLLVGCGIASDDSARDIPDNALPEALQNETTTTTVSDEPGRTSIERLFLVEASSDGATEQLAEIPVEIEVPEGPSGLPAALVQALADARPTELGFPSLTNSVPPGLEVLRTDLGADGVLDLDVSELDSVEGSGQRLAVAQIVFTLTELADIDAVRFFDDGEPVAVPIESGTAPAGTPVRRIDDPSLLASLRRSETG
ncbi:GerMN domain-containing protein [Rhabdothermincola salaria]|uniref:GerMN domain-containing protein n=1 Tax=Rhabdothermincola salaria TaxID=2903142 RepID=UPI001E523E2C|nr:GerMN domain-containing protein [Rhabdothermincola salaria]MCD9622450.1 GerMN domain-containing protein [Rhabdothermincola salaria]